MLILRHWFVIPVECLIRKKVRNNVGLDLIDNYIRFGDVTL